MIKCNEHAIGETSIIFDVITTHSATLQKKFGKPHRRNPKKWKAQSHKKIMIKIDHIYDIWRASVYDDGISNVSQHSENDFDDWWAWIYW